MAKRIISRGSISSTLRLAELSQAALTVSFPHGAHRSVIQTTIIMCRLTMWSLCRTQTFSRRPLAWLNDPSLPLGTVQRQWELKYGTNKAPASELNAYQGATSTDAAGRLTGG